MSEPCIVDVQHENGDRGQAVLLPAGHVCLVMTREEAESYATWTEAVAVRIKLDGDEIASLEVTNDLDWVTGPESADA